MSCIYVIYSNSIGKFYIGSSREDNSQKRLNSHNSGKTKSTKFGRPWLLIFEEYYNNYSEARRRELFLKTGQGRKIIKERWQSGRMRQS